MDPAKRNKDFANELHITFPVLSDENKEVTKQYGVLYPLIHVAKRVTFVIDREGVIRSITEGGEAADPNKTRPSDRNAATGYPSDSRRSCAFFVDGSLIRFLRYCDRSHTACRITRGQRGRRDGPDCAAAAGLASVAVTTRL